MSLLLGIAIGTIVGWNFPQPAWSAAIWAAIKAKYFTK